MKWMSVSIMAERTPHQTSTTTHTQNKLLNYVYSKNAFAALHSRAKTKANAVPGRQSNNSQTNNRNVNINNNNNNNNNNNTIISNNHNNFNHHHTIHHHQANTSSKGLIKETAATPCHRWYHSASIVEQRNGDHSVKRMFVFGGTTNTSYNVLLNDLHYIEIPEDFCTSRSEMQNVPIFWQKVDSPNPPSKRWGHTGLAWNKYLVVFGGCDGYMYLNELLFFDTETMQWERRAATGKYPVPRAGHKAAIVNDNIMVLFGGWNGSHLNDVHFLDLEKMEWLDVNVKGCSPPARADHAITIVGSKMFLFGGEGVGYDIKLGDVYALDFDRMEWSHIETYGPKPTARHSHSVSAIGNHIVVFGGYDDQYNQCNDVWILDSTSMTWRQAFENHHGQLGVVGRQGHSACVFRSKVIFFAGFNGGALNDTFILDTELCDAHSMFSEDIACLASMGTNC